MKFRIMRASNYNGNPDVDGSVENILKEYKDIRCFESLEEWKLKYPKDFKREIISTGYTKENHYPYMIINGNHITVWTIEITDLFDFINKYGSVIINPPSEEYVDFEDLYELIIYDDYME